MSRNRYAVILLVVLALTLWLAGRYVNRTTATLCNELQTACTLAETGQMPQAQQAYRAAADNAAQASKVLGMLVRRNLIDQMNQTLSLLPGCAKEENLTDLTLETDRPAASCNRYSNHFSAVFDRLSSMSFNSSIKVLTSLNWR